MEDTYKTTLSCSVKIPTRPKSCVIVCFIKTRVSPKQVEGKDEGFFFPDQLFGRPTQQQIREKNIACESSTAKIQEAEADERSCRAT